MALPLNLPLEQMQTKWKSQIDPALSNVLFQGRLIQNVSLATGNNTINHGLGRPLIGWFLTRRPSSATVYDNQSTNPTPALTLSLNASTSVTVSLYVF